MKTGFHKWFGASLLTLMLVAGGCSQAQSNTYTTVLSSASDEQQESDDTERKQATSVQFGEDDLDSSWNESEAESISFAGDSVATSANRGVFIEDTEVTIALPGTYVLSGQLNNGSVHIKLETDGDVRLIMQNASIHNENGAAIFVEDAGKVIITLADGTSNTLSDGAQYQLADGTDEPSGTLYSKADLTINGTGKLVVNANYNDAIVGKDTLLLVDGQYEITSVDDGIIGRDVLAVKQGSYTLHVDGDGMKSTNDNADKLGKIYIAGGQFNITAGADGMDSIGELSIEDGSFTISSGGGAQAAASDSNSAKAIKAAGLLTIQGGSFELDAYEDAIHSNDSVDIYGGKFTIAAGDDAVHGDGTVTIYDGQINVTTSYEGLEGAQIAIHGGNIELTTSDDGVNVAGGNDQSAAAGRGGASFASNSNNKLVITGGQLIVNANGDGLDSNGSIEMSGGTVVVNGPEDNGNGALDYDGSFTLTGGTLVAAGSSGMAMAASAEQSTQPSILMYYPATQAAGTLMQLSNSDGDVLVAFQPSKSYQSIFISSPDIQIGETYSILSGGQSQLVEGLELGTMTPSQLGTELVSFTISDVVSYVDENGLTTMQGMHGGFGGGPGGGGGQGGFGGGERGEGQGEFPSGERGQRAADAQAAQ